MKNPANKTKPAAYPTLLTGIGALLEESRRAVVRAANCFMTATYWEVGRRIVEFEQDGKRRAEYGEELLERLSRDLTERHGRGFGVDNLERFRQFFLRYPASNISATLLRKSSGSTESAILQTLSAKSDSTVRPISATALRKFTQPDWIEFLQALAARFPLPWSHYVKRLTVKDENARRFYEDEALRGGWSFRQLDRQIGIILCSSADAALARYTLDTLPNKVMAREYQLALPAVKKLEAELAATRKRLERAGKKLPPH